MSGDLSIEPVGMELDANEPDDGLWHIAASDAEDEHSERGLPWRTHCGQVRPRLRASKPYFVNEPSDCLVCCALYEAEMAQ